MSHDISGVALIADGTLACVSLFDAPLYSIFIMKVGDAKSPFKIIEQRSMLSIMEYESYQDVLTNTKLLKGNQAAN